MRPFVDANVLVYAATADDPHKQLVAQRLLTTYTPSGLTISTQVLVETYNVLTRKKRWVPADALRSVSMLAGALRTVTLGTDAVLGALQLAAGHQLSPWDALVVHAALEAGCDTLFSEDLQDGRRYGVLQVVNPFTLSAHETQEHAALVSAAAFVPKARRKAGPKARP